jgi:hypothetical protein
LLGVSYYDDCDLPPVYTELAIAAARTWRRRMQRLRKSSIIRETVGRTQVRSSSIRVEEVGVAREDGNPAIRMGAVHEEGITSRAILSTDNDKGPYREKTVANMYAFEGEYTFSEPMF